MILLLFLSFVVPLGGNAVTVIPPILEGIKAEPGKTYEGKFQIHNGTDAPHIYYFIAQNFGPSDEEGTPGIESEEESQLGLASWIEYESDQLMVAVGETQTVRFKINVPNDAEPGGHYAAIFTSTSPPEEVKKIGLGERTGVLLLVTVPGEIREKSELVEFSLAAGKKMYNRPPVEFLLRVKNDGNIHFKPLGDITINGWGGEKAKIEANPKRGNILPQSIRAFHPVWKAVDLKEGGFMAELKNEWNNFGFGRYNAHLEMVWGSNDEKIISNIKFWVFPWRVLLVVLIILIIILLLIRSYNKAIRRGVQKKKK